MSRHSSEFWRDKRILHRCGGRLCSCNWLTSGLSSFPSASALSPACYPAPPSASVRLLLCRHIPACSGASLSAVDEAADCTCLTVRLQTGMCMPYGLWLQVTTTHSYLERRPLSQTSATQQLKQTRAPPRRDLHGHAQAVSHACMQLQRRLAQWKRDIPSRLKFSSFTLSITCSMKQTSLHLCRIHPMAGQACRGNQYEAQNPRGPKCLRNADMSTCRWW